MNQSSRSRQSRNSQNVKSASSKTQESGGSERTSQKSNKPGSYQSKSFTSTPIFSKSSQSLKTQPSGKSGSRMNENSVSEEKWEGRSQMSNYPQEPSQGREESTTGKNSSVKKSKNSTLSSGKYRSKERSERRSDLKSDVRRTRTYRDSRRTSLPVYDATDSYFPTWGSDSESVAPQLLNDIMKYRIYDYPIKLQNEEDILQWRKAYNLRHKMKQYDLSTRQKLYRNNMINPKAKFIREKYVFLNKIPEHRSAFPIPKDPTDVQKSNVIQTYLKTHAAFILSEKLLARGNKGKLNHADQMKLMRALNNPLANFIGPDNYEKLKLGIPKHERRKHKGGRTRTSNQYRSHPLYAGFDNRPLPDFGSAKVTRNKYNTKGTTPSTQKQKLSKPKTQAQAQSQMHSSDVGRKRKSGKEASREADKQRQRGILKPSHTHRESVPMRTKGKGGTHGEIGVGVGTKRMSSKRQGEDRTHKQERVDAKKKYDYEFSFDGKNKMNRSSSHSSHHENKQKRNRDDEDSEYSDDSRRNRRMANEKREDHVRDREYPGDHSKDNSYEEKSSNSRTTASDNSFYKSNGSNKELVENTAMTNYGDVNNTNQFNFMPHMNSIHTPVGTYMQHVNGINVIEQPGIMNLIEIPSSYITPPAVYEHPAGSTNIGYMNMVNIPDPNCNVYSNPYHTNCDNYPTTIISGIPNGTSTYYQEPTTVMTNVQSGTNGYYQEPNTLLSNNQNSAYFQEPTDMEDEEYRNKNFQGMGGLSGESSCSDSYTNDSTITEDFSRSVSSTGSSSNRSDMSFQRDLKEMAHKTEALHSKTKEDRYAMAGNLKTKNSEDLNVRLFLKHM